MGQIESTDAGCPPEIVFQDNVLERILMARPAITVEPPGVKLISSTGLAVILSRSGA